jgi:hypothetical protein
MNQVTVPKEFSDFLSYFPTIPLPLTIQHSDHHHYSKTNDVLPDFEIDEFTEFLPCFEFEFIPKMHHLVLWSARLMHYSFHLMNFNDEGVFLGISEIAGFYTLDNSVLQKMAHVDAVGNLFLIEACLDDKQQDVSLETTKKWQLEILPDGRIRSFETGF